MRNIALALAMGCVVLGVLFFPGLLKFGESLVPAVLVTMIGYVVLARRTFRQVEAVFARSAADLQQAPPKFANAIRTMEQAYVYAGHQIGVRSQVDTQIGVVYFLQREFNKALPYLQRSLNFGHWMGGAMLGVIYYKKKDHAKMRETFKTVTKRGKKQALPWCLYAYLLCQIGARDEAQTVLVDGSKKVKDDPRVNEALLALQNGKKIKMRNLFKEQWYQFHLEKPPQVTQQVGMGGKMGKIARRGRWR